MHKRNTGKNESSVACTIGQRVLSFLAAFSWLLLVPGCAVKPFTGYTTTGELPVLLDSETYLLQGVSNNPNYAYTPKYPVHVGGYDKANFQENVDRYLNALKGPSGEAIQFIYQGTCCEYKSARDQFGLANLEVYEIRFYGQELSPLLLYLDVYHVERLEAPNGLTYRLNPIP